MTQASEAVEAMLADVEGSLVTAAAPHADKTGVRVASNLHWLHVFSPPTLTRYGMHAKWGREAIDALGLLPCFQGELVHDGWSAYATYPQCGHALCGAHLLRELTFLHEQYQQTWAAEMKALLLQAKAAVEVARLSSAQALHPTDLDAFTQAYDARVAAGFAANPSPETRPGKRWVAESPPVSTPQAPGTRP